MTLPKPDKTTTKKPQKSAIKSATSAASKPSEHLKSSNLSPSNLEPSKLKPINTVAVDARALNQQAKLHPLLDHEIPAALTKRYAIKDHVYYSKNPSIGMVFEDKGQSIRAKSSDADDVRAMVELAKSKHWSTIKVTGTAEFKREVWLAASIQGLQVAGYTPTQQDVALLENAQTKTQNKIEFTHSAPTAAEVAIIASAKAKGADPKSIQAMKQCVALTVRKLQAMGVEIPKPKVYDAKAPSLKDQAVEIDRPQFLKDRIQPQISRAR